MILTWLGLAPKFRSEPVDNSKVCLDGYLKTAGAKITADSGGNAMLSTLHIDAGKTIALLGSSTFHKHYLCDWLLGFVEAKNTKVSLELSNGKNTTRAVEPHDRAQHASVLGRSPILCGETIQEALTFRTHHVRKSELKEMVEHFFGPTLRAKTNPEARFFDRDGAPVSTHSLTAREHLEIAQINVLLQKTPVIILDLSSELMAEAMAQGFVPAPELFTSGKTVLTIVPPSRDLKWAETVLKHKFEQTLTLN